MDETVLDTCSGVAYSQHNAVDVAYILITVVISYNNDNDDSESLRSYHFNHPKPEPRSYDTTPR